jgi:3-dehydroquinate synthase
VTVGSGVIDSLRAELADDLGAVALIADSNLTSLHAARVAEALGPRRVVPLEFEAGEQHKHRSTKEDLEDAMLDAGLGRDCVVVALGGGVTTDLGGFVAATYMRGVPWIALPTSLLGAVDASIGGKTGLDTDRGKNLIGAFHQPRAVVIDLTLMATLPAGEVDNGLAEMIKHAVIADAEYLVRIGRDAASLRRLRPETLAPAIVRSIEIKSEVVAADTAERDFRQVLNLGHTIGHAIELESEYGVGHGLAVAAGVSVECGIAARLGLMSEDDRDEVRAALQQVGLPIAPPAGIDRDALLRATARDKKSRGGVVRYALPAGVGRMARGEAGWGHEVPDEVVMAAISEV